MDFGVLAAFFDCPKIKEDPMVAVSKIRSMLSHRKSLSAKVDEFNKELTDSANDSCDSLDASISACEESIAKYKELTKDRRNPDVSNDLSGLDDNYRKMCETRDRLQDELSRLNCTEESSRHLEEELSLKVLQRMNAQSALETLRAEADNKYQARVRVVEKREQELEEELKSLEQEQKRREKVFSDCESLKMEIDRVKMMNSDSSQESLASTEEESPVNINRLSRLTHELTKNHRNGDIIRLIGEELNWSVGTVASFSALFSQSSQSSQDDESFSKWLNEQISE